MDAKKICILAFVLAVLMGMNHSYASGKIGIPKTGQTTSLGAGDDGALQRGTVWPTPRFTDNENGTITDNLTGLIWLKNADCFGGRAWSDALVQAAGLADGACGLTDGSVARDWRLPNRNELASLVDYSKASPPLPDGHPFNNVREGYYWTSSTYKYDTSQAWYFYTSYGYLNYFPKIYEFLVWPVRGGQ